MLKTQLRILTQCLLVLGVGALAMFLQIREGIPLWVGYVLCLAVGCAWRLWSRSKRRRSTAPEPTIAFEDGDLSPSIHEWLEAATHGLGEMAKRRISKDIGSHYFDARAAAIEEGLPTLEAELRAVKTLGNPRSARRGFRKVYLTKREEAWIKKNYSPGSSQERFAKDMAPAQAILGILALFLLAFSVLVGGGPINGIMIIIVLALMFVVLGVGTSLQYRWMRQGRTRRAKVTELLGCGFVGFAVSPAMLLTHSLDNYPFSKMGMAALPFFCAFSIVLGLRTLGKLPKELSAEERRFFKRES